MRVSVTPPFPFRCGALVYDETDPRHIGRVVANYGHGKVATWTIVKWLETGWRSVIDSKKLRMAPDDAI